MKIRMRRLVFCKILFIFIAQVHIAIGQNYQVLYDENALIQGRIVLVGENAAGQVEGLPVFKVAIPNVKQNQEAKVELIVLGTRNITITEVESIPENYRYEPYKIRTRGQDQWYVDIIPVRKSGNNIELITGFTLNIQVQSIASSGSRNFPPQVVESVLATGDIYKIGIQKTGIHKIDVTYLENKLGIKANQIDPRNIKIYGNGGGRLPLSNGDFREDDLVENAIFVSGESDGKFDSDDFLLFYAEGPDVWRYDQSSNQFNFDKNIYDEKNYYFLKVDNQPGLRMKVEALGPENPDLVFDTYESLQHFEEDKINLLGANPGTYGTGKEWFGDYFKGTRLFDYTSKFDFTDLVVGASAQVKGQFVGRSNKTSSVVYKFGSNSYTVSLSSVNIEDSEATYAHKASTSQKLNFTEANPTISVSYPTNSGDSEGWLDYLQIICEKRLVPGQSALSFRHRAMGNAPIAAFKLTGFSNYTIWDITNPLQPSIMTINGNLLSFRQEGRFREFIAHQGIAHAIEPVSGQKIPNQNLHQLTEAELLVVYHPDFENAVQEFIAHREKHSSMKVVWATVEQVYNEFSSGKLDPVAIRDLARMLYDRDPNFKYLLLFGDGSYDYKGLMPNLKKEYFVPVYETDQSLNPIIGFPSDDFFGLLDENEGKDLFGGLDISVGRLPVKSTTEAENVVQKIIHYDNSPASLGDWRLRTGYAADDEDSGRHIIDTDEIARRTENNFPLYNHQKTYFDAFPQVATAGDPRYPEANEALNANIFAGQLTLTYLGHGGPQGWAQERVLTLKDIKSWTNYNKLFLMITATCSFAAYDDPKLVSPGEEAILNSKGGAIALFSTTRAVYTNSNKELTDAVHRVMYQKINGKAPTFGQILLEGKNKNGSLFTIENSRKFTLLGDPSQQIALPQENIVVTKINQKPVGQNTDTLKAMSFVEMEGYIADGNLNPLTDFNGTVFTTIFDKKNVLQTLQNDSRSPLFEFDLYQNIIFKGKASVKNGKFMVGFWVPKDINYKIGNGRISLYASDGISRDAGGYNNSVLIGGSAGNGVVDDTPPNVDIFINDESFVQGGITNENPTLLVKLQDDFGINVTGNAVGHDITSILNENTAEANVLNDFFESETDNYKEGTVRFPLKNLAPGKHTVRVKAWDIANNSAEKTTDFLVVSSQQEFLERVINYPNPFTTNTRFEFDHDLNNTNLDIHVYVYSVSGKLVKTIEHSGYYPGNRINDVRWNGRDDYDDKLARGVYLYKIKIYSRELNLMRESKFEKLVIL